MAPLEPLIDVKKLDFDLIEQFVDQKISIHSSHYDKEMDTLYIYFKYPDMPTVVHFMDEFLAAIYNPKDLKVIGFMVEYLSLYQEKNKKLNKFVEKQRVAPSSFGYPVLMDIKEKQEMIIAKDFARVTEALV